MRALTNNIQSEDGVANAAIHEAAQRLEEQQERIKRLEEAGSLALGYAAKGDLESADEVWDKAKEAKL
jgi:predicted enzyme involved in methoxymalonyl-ACP biosynthesis